jgi:hypothetical protein
VPSSAQPIVTTEEEAPALSQPAVVPQEHNAPEGMARDAFWEIQEAGESSSAALPRDVGGGDAWVLELACIPWTAAFEVGDNAEDDEEATVCNTLERGLAWARCTFDELILPTTSVSFLCTNDLFFTFPILLRCVAYIQFVWGRYSRRLVGGERAQRASSARSGPSWRCNWAWLKWRRPQRWRSRRRRRRLLNLPSSPRKTWSHCRDRVGCLGIEAGSCRG